MNGQVHIWLHGNISMSHTREDVSNCWRYWSA